MARIITGTMPAMRQFMDSSSGKKELASVPIGSACHVSHEQGLEDAPSEAEAQGVLQRNVRDAGQLRNPLTLTNRDHLGEAADFRVDRDLGAPHWPAALYHADHAGDRIVGQEQ